MSKPIEYKADYTAIAAKPTTYSDVIFRSRLEARWASLFYVDNGGHNPPLNGKQLR